jgi:hypothetical protein
LGVAKEEGFALSTISGKIHPVPKPLRVISLNFPFTTQGVVNEETLATPIALFDFDVVVVRPHVLLPTNEKGRNWRVEWDDFRLAKRLARGKTEEFRRFFAGGGLLVVILDTIESCTYKSGNYSYTGPSDDYCTNYDFLADSFWRCIRNGTGSNYTSGDLADPFDRVLRQSQVVWTAYVHDVPPAPFDQPSVFARNGPLAFVGARFYFGGGRVILLPNFSALHEGEFLDAC